MRRAGYARCSDPRVSGRSSDEAGQTLLTAGLDAACAGRDYRACTDLHATERALIAFFADYFPHSRHRE